MIKTTNFNLYYRLAKPGIIRGNLITAVAGFILASGKEIHFTTLVLMVIGLALIIGSSCVINNYIDRGIDEKMDRTRNRALVTKQISNSNAFIYCGVLLTTGSLILGILVNPLSLYIALIGVFFYVAVYGIAKRLSPLGTLVGSISGAVPPLVGYAAAAGKLDVAAVILFFILVAWQMPHFYAIAIYRLDDYKRAGIPVLPAVKGIAATKKQILFYVQIYLFLTLSLSVFGYTGYTYFAVASLFGIIWVCYAMNGLKTTNDIKWSQGMFRFSLIALSTLSLTIYFNDLLP